MKTIAIALLFFTAMTTQAKPVAIVIHAGAGRIDRDSFTPEHERLYHATLEQSLRAGHAILKGGGSALDAVEAATVIMEDAPVFNAGKGAVFTAEGKNELDASIMDGRALQAASATRRSSARAPTPTTAPPASPAPAMANISSGTPSRTTSARASHTRKKAWPRPRATSCKPCSSRPAAPAASSASMRRAMS